MSPSYGGHYTELVIKIDIPLQSKTRYASVLEPRYPEANDDWQEMQYRAAMYSSPAVQLTESYIAERAFAAKNKAMQEAAAAGHSKWLGFLDDPKKRCTVVVRLGDVLQAGNTDNDNILKLIMDGLSPAILRSDVQVDSFRLDSPRDGKESRKNRKLTVISIMSSRSLTHLELMSDRYKGAYVYPGEDAELSFTKRNKNLSEIPVLNLGDSMRR